MKVKHTSSWMLLLIGIIRQALGNSVEPPVSTFIRGAELVGGTNGMVFDEDNNLYACQVLGQTIAKIDPESGAVLSRLGVAESVIFADDVALGPNRTLYWTDVFVGTLFRRPLPDGPTEPLFPLGTYPSANPLAFSDDGTRLFFAQCFGEVNGIYQYDLATGAVETLLSDIPGCASNSMDYMNEALYGPRLFEGKIYKLDLANDNTVTDVSTGMGNPVACKFDSAGTLHCLDAADGKVYRIDIEDTADTASNRELVAQAPFPSLDNLAFDRDDRLYVSSYGRGTVLEVLGESDFRTVSPGDVSLFAGVTVLGAVLYASSPLGIHSFYADTAEPRSTFDPLALQQPSLIVAWPERNLLVYPSFTLNVVVVWDPVTETTELSKEMPAPTDVLPFQGGLMVTSLTTGNITMMTGGNFSEHEVLFTIPGAFFLAGNDDVVYASNFETGEILQLVADGNVLETPATVSSNHSAPEGIALLEDGDLLVVASGSGTLERVDLSAAATVDEKVVVVASGLEFLPPIPDVLPFSYSNDVVVYDKHAFVNGDKANVIYKISLGDEDTSEAASLWTSSTVLFAMLGYLLLYATQ